MEASTEIAVTCDVDAPSAMAFWKRTRKQLPLRRAVGRGENRNDAQLLPEFGDGAQNRPFRHFPSQGVLQLRDGGVAGFKMFVGLDGQRRNRARSGQLRAAPPVAVAPQSVDVGQYPTGHDEIGLLAGLTEQIQAHGHAVGLQADQQILGLGDGFGCGSRVVFPGYSFNKGWRDKAGILLPREKQTEPGLLDPRPGVLERECPITILAHPFGARCFQLFCCQRKTSLPGWRNHLPAQLLRATRLPSRDPRVC